MDIRKLFIIFVLCLLFSSCGKVSTEDAKNLYLENRTEFDKMFKSFSEQKQIRFISLSDQYGFMKFSIGFFTQSKKTKDNMYKGYDGVTIKPEFSIGGDIEFDEEAIELLESKNLDVKGVTEYCKFIRKFKLYEIYMIGDPFQFRDLFMYRRNTVRFMLNPYQGFEYTRPAGQPPSLLNNEVFELDSSIYYFTQL